jgi:hypothetical protein
MAATSKYVALQATSSTPPKPPLDPAESSVPQAWPQAQTVSERDPNSF